MSSSECRFVEVVVAVRMLRVDLVQRLDMNDALMHLMRPSVQGELGQIR
jgi:hypothetical protein